jgi:phytoene dehydrogenase-like protein
MAFDFDVIVIGAGHNGLTCAAALARRGRGVCVLERADHVGGMAAGHEFHPGYTTAGLLGDTGGVRPAIVDDLGLQAHGLRRGSAAAAIVIKSSEGPAIVLQDDVEATRNSIGAVSETDARAYAAYRKTLSRYAPALRGLLDAVPPDVIAGGLAGLWPMIRTGVALRRLGADDLVELARIAPMPVRDWMDEQFETAALKAGLAQPGVALSGLGPRAAGTTFNLLIHESMSGPQVVGGAAALVNALEAAARSAGAEIRTGAQVERVCVESGAVTGVALSDGTTLTAPVVAASCDPRRALLDMLNVTDLGRTARHQADHYRICGGTAVVHLALQGPVRLTGGPADEDAAFFRTGGTLDDLERAADALKYRQIAERPALSIYVPTQDTPGLAPTGHAVATVLADGVPFNLDGGWDAAARNRVQERILAEVQRVAPDVLSHLVAAHTLTPRDLAETYGLSGGHLHHGAHHLDQRIVRPIASCARYDTPVQGLYLAGSGSHPGGGVTCAPGWLAARRIIG